MALGIEANGESQCSANKWLPFLYGVGDGAHPFTRGSNASALKRSIASRSLAESLL
jgi:hypothetical protein